MRQRAPRLYEYTVATMVRRVGRRVRLSMDLSELSSFMVQSQIDSSRVSDNLVPNRDVKDSETPTCANRQDLAGRNGKRRRLNGPVVTDDADPTINMSKQKDEYIEHAISSTQLIGNDSLSTVAAASATHVLHASNRASSGDHREVTRKSTQMHLPSEASRSRAPADSSSPMQHDLRQQYPLRTSSGPLEILVKWPRYSQGHGDNSIIKYKAVSDNFSPMFVPTAR